MKHHMFQHLFFFFQAEDGIRDFHVTGVQTCALPICYDGGWAEYVRRREERATPPPAPEPKPRKAKAKPIPVQKQRPSELEQLESEIAAREEALSGLERKLADDWADVETPQTPRSKRTTRASASFASSGAGTTAPCARRRALGTGSKVVSPAASD